MYKFLTSQLLWQILLVLALLALILRAVARKRRVRKGEECYRDYAALLRKAFKEDRRSRKIIMEAITYLRSGKAKRAERMLGHLMVECREEEDFIALRVLMALCYQQMDAPDKALQYYRRVLEDAAEKRPLRDALFALNAHGGRPDIVETACNGIVFEDENA